MMPGTYHFLEDVLTSRRQADEVLKAATEEKIASEGTRILIELLQTILTAEIACVLRHTAISVLPDGLKDEKQGRNFESKQMTSENI